MIPVHHLRCSLTKFVVVIGVCWATSTAAQDPAAATDDVPLVVRDQIRLTLAGAQTAIEVCLQKAAEIGVAVNISVVDDGGHLIAFVRMDGARPGSVYTSMTKATSAATKRGATGSLEGGSDLLAIHLNLAVENAAAASGGKFTTLLGGVPIIVDGDVIGAIGVGGASGEQDAQVAGAGVESLVTAIRTPMVTESKRNASDSDDQATAKTIWGTWQVEDVAERGVVDRSNITMQIDHDGQIAGSTGVNRYTGKVRIEGNRLITGPLATTRRAGPPALMDQETKFVDALGRVATYQIDEQGILRLRDANGAELLRLVRGEPDQP